MMVRFLIDELAAIKTFRILNSYSTIDFNWDFNISLTLIDPSFLVR